MSEATKSEVTTVIITADNKTKFLACLKGMDSLATKAAEVFKTIFDATFSESDSENEFAVAKIVKAQLTLVATDAGYSEAYVERVLSECMTANGLVKVTASKRTGREPEVVPTSRYTAAAAAFDVLAGTGVSPSKKALRQVSNILLALGKEEGEDGALTISEVKAYRAPIREIKTDRVEAGKIVAIPAPVSSKATAKAA